MIGFVIHYFLRAVELFQKYYAHKLVRICRLSEAEPHIGTLLNGVRKPERAAYYKGYAPAYLINV